MRDKSLSIVLELGYQQEETFPDTCSLEKKKKNNKRVDILVYSRLRLLSYESLSSLANTTDH